MKKSRGKKSYSFPEYESIEGLGLTSTASTQALLLEKYRAMEAQMMQQVVPSWYSQLGVVALSPPTEAPPKPPSIDADKLAKLQVAEPYKVQRRMPDYVSVITAWRAWDVVNRGGWRLEALGRKCVWEPKKQMDAVCVKSDKNATATGSIFGAVMGRSSPSHPAPQMDCTCGIWAFKDLERLVETVGNTYSTIKVLGQVSLWGRVVETENGYRAEHGYPSELWLLDDSLEELGLIYDVPVRRVG